MKIRKSLLTTLLLTSVLAIAMAVTSYAKVRLTAPDETYWDGEKATWEAVENSSKYQLRLYRDGSYVSGSEIETKKTTYNFKSKLVKEGYYTFRVRAIGKGNSYSDSSWSEYSDEILITTEEAEKIVAANEAARAAKVANVNTGGSGPGDDTNSTNTASQTATTGAWKQDTTGWWYVNSDNTYPTNQWQQINGAWYYFKETGYMATGWLTLDTNTYYCDPTTGIMQTGTQTIDSIAYTFDTTGVMIK